MAADKADDFDVEALLEETYNKVQPLPVPEDNTNNLYTDTNATTTATNNNNDKSPDERSEKEAGSPPPSDEDDRKKRKKKKRSKSRSRSRSRSHSPRRRSSRRSRSRSRDRDRHKYRRHRHRSRSRSRSRERRRHRSRDRDYRDREYRDRDRGRDRDKDRERDRDKDRNSPPSVAQPIGSYKRQRSPDLEPPSVDRDNRTIMCMQLSAKVTNRDLEDFFMRAGVVRDVHIIADRQSRRSKGIAYVEFQEESSVFTALSFSGQKVHGIPIMIQPTMAEKNRLAAAAENLKKAEGPKKLYVGSLHYNITEDMLQGIFSPFGNVERVSIMRDTATNVSRGYAFVEFRDSDSAERAMANLNGFELAGRPMKVNYGTVDTSLVNIDSLDGEDMDVGVGMTPQSRVALMHKLAAGHNADMSIPGVQAPPPPFAVPTMPACITSCCFVIGNMFDPSKETGSDWDKEIREDVLEECVKFGNIFHIHVDKFSQGKVYIKSQTPQTASAAVGSFNGRRYAGNVIHAELVPENTYHLKFPGALAATVPLKPSL